MPPNGIFNLRTASDLRQKLRHDLDRLKWSPTNTYEAFNFFVTAEHLLDWQFPGYDDKAQRERVRSEEVILQITSHLANGAKHFQTQAKHHRSV